MHKNYKYTKEGYARGSDKVNKTVDNMQSQAIKIDALWKPIIRKFRQFIKMRVVN